MTIEQRLQALEARQAGRVSVLDDRDAVIDEDAILAAAAGIVARRRALEGTGLSSALTIDEQAIVISGQRILERRAAVPYNADEDAILAAADEIETQRRSLYL